MNDYESIKWNEIELDDDQARFVPSDSDFGDGAVLARLEDLGGILACPDTRESLVLSHKGLRTAAGEPVGDLAGAPILLPRRALKHIRNERWDMVLEPGWSAFDQYCYVNYVKNAGTATNAEGDDPWYQRHLCRSRRLLEGASGLVLDVGCDEPNRSRLLFPNDVRYFGIDPSLARKSGFRAIGMAEFLPVADVRLDGVSFLTTLDHVFDYHTALAEAHRVLKVGGVLYLATLIWDKNAELYNDNVHFHHFRDFEIKGALRGFRITSLKRYGWKNEKHRYGIYLRAVKTA